MELLKTIMLNTVISIIATAILAPLLIHLLYKFNFVVNQKLMPNGMNAEFIKIHGHKSGTPTLGGFMISITVFILSLIFLPGGNLKTIFLVFWILFTLYGFADGLIVYGRKLSTKFKLLEASFEWKMGKFLVLYLITLGSLFCTVRYLGVDKLTFFGLSIQINYLVLILGTAFSVYAISGIEVTDGADGLVTGQIIINIVAFSLLSVLTGKAELLPMISFIFGSCIVYLYFNINPARIFMGGTGTFPIAFALILFSVITDTVDILIIMGLMYWIEMSSSVIQIISIKFFKKKLFKIAPLHHHFEAIGWPETKTVQRFWLFTGICTIISLLIFAITR